jgi:hypothetical protein
MLFVGCSSIKQWTAYERDRKCDETPEPTGNLFSGYDDLWLYMVISSDSSKETMNIIIDCCLVTNISMSLL